MAMLNNQRVTLVIDNHQKPMSSPRYEPNLAHYGAPYEYNSLYPIHIHRFSP